jgi:hypothetical protein
MTKAPFRIRNGQREYFSRGARKWIAVAGEPPPAAAPTARVRRRNNNPRVMLRLGPLAKATKASTARKAGFIWAWLQYEAWRTKCATITVTNGELEAYGVDRERKRHVLHAFEKAGLVTIKRPKKAAVTVTVIDPDYLYAG